MTKTKAYRVYTECMSRKNNISYNNAAPFNFCGIITT